MVNIKRLFLGEVVALDEAGNVAFFNGEGNPHETISAHCGAQMEAHKVCKFCGLVCWFIQSVLGKVWPKLKTHCPDSWETEKKMVQDSRNAAGVDKNNPGGPL